jgi:hypothetical protein
MNSDHLIFNDFERMIRRLSLLRLGKWKISFTIIASKCCSYSFYSLKIKKSFDTTAKCGINQVEKPGEACPTPVVSPGCHPEPIRFAQGKLREGSVARGSEMLRCAQHDRAGTPAVSPVVTLSEAKGLFRWACPRQAPLCLTIALIYISTDPPGSMVARKPE